MMPGPYNEHQDALMAGGHTVSEEQFIRLVEEYQGFELYQAYSNDVDHILGGKNNTFWYVIMKKGKVSESYIARYEDGVWTDTFTKGRGEKKISKPLPSGSTIKMICENAYLMQEEKWVKGRKGKLIEDSHPHYHFVYGFGDRGLDVSQQYGVTIAYSDIHDLSTGFHLRYLYTGSEVEAP